MGLASYMGGVVLRVVGLLFIFLGIFVFLTQSGEICWVLGVIGFIILVVGSYYTKGRR